MTLDLAQPRLYEGHLGARLNLETIQVDGSRYWEWWFDNYGDEAVLIAQAFVADLPASILPSRPAGSSRVVGSCSESPVGRPPSRVKSVVQLPTASRTRED